MGDLVWDRGTPLRWSEGAPDWLKVELKAQGLPLEFTLEELTDGQKLTLQTLHCIYVMEDLGMIEVLTMEDGTLGYRKTEFFDDPAVRERFLKEVDY